jgi:hypothetical protein
VGGEPVCTGWTCGGEFLFSPGFLVSLFLLKIMHTTPRINEKGNWKRGEEDIRGGEGRGKRE